MRVRALLPAAGLVLLAGTALAQVPVPGAAAPSSPPAASEGASAPSSPGGSAGGGMAGHGEGSMPMMRRGGMDHHRRHHGMMAHSYGSPSRGEAAGLAPSIRLRHGGVDLDMQCSVRETAQECAEAALSILDGLQPFPGTEPAAGGGGDSPGDASR